MTFCPFCGKEIHVFKSVPTRNSNVEKRPGAPAKPETTTKPGVEQNPIQQVKPSIVTTTPNINKQSTPDVRHASTGTPTTSVIAKTSAVPNSVGESNHTSLRPQQITSQKLLADQKQTPSTKSQPITDSAKQEPLVFQEQKIGGSSQPLNNKNYHKLIIGIAISVIAIIALIIICLNGCTQDNVGNPVITPIPEGSISQTDLEKADEAYLKKTSIIDGKKCWILDSIRSDKYCSLISVFNSGDINAFDDCVYNEIPSSSREYYWNQIMDCIHKISPTEAQNIIFNGLEGNIFHIQEVAEMLNGVQTVTAISTKKTPKENHILKKSVDTPKIEKKKIATTSKKTATEEIEISTPSGRKSSDD